MFSLRTIHVLPSKGVSSFVIWGEVPIIWTQHPPWIWENPWWFHVNFPGCHGNPPTHLWEKRISIFVQWILLNHVDPMWKFLRFGLQVAPYLLGKYSNPNSKTTHQYHWFAKISTLPSSLFARQARLELWANKNEQFPNQPAKGLWRDSEHGIIHQIPEAFESFRATGRFRIDSLHQPMLYLYNDSLHQS